MDQSSVLCLEIIINDFCNFSISQSKSIFLNEVQKNSFVLEYCDDTGFQIVNKNQSGWENGQLNCESTAREEI